MNQLALHLPPVAATGEAARHLIGSDQLRRLRQQAGLAQGDRFYIMHTGDWLHVWGGKGKVPQWVKEWIAQGGELDQLRAKI